MTSWSRLASGSALAALAISAAFVAPAQAQDITATARGTITGSNGPVAGAQVLLTHTPSGTRSSVRTNSAGTFISDGLRPGGPYKIEVNAAGFASASIDDAFFVVGTPFELNLELEAATAGTVVVQASRVARNRVDGSNTTFGRDGIEGISTPNRDIRELANRSPFATSNIAGDGGISIAGSNPRTNRITIDGVAAQDDFGLNTGGLPTRRGPIALSAIQSVSISPSPSDVRNGNFVGGAIDIVTRSGDNNFSGSIEGTILRPDFVGDSLNGTPIRTDDVEENSWEVNFRGPILRDRLFFAAYYSTFEAIDSTFRGPANAGFPSTIIGPGNAPLTQADIDAVTSIFTGTGPNNYGSNYPVGSIPTSKPITDDKYGGRIDWNITDNQRLSFSYRNAESVVFNFTNLNASTASLDSMWYFTGEIDETMSAQLNSTWTDAFSTELRISRRDYTRLQEPPAGQNFSDISVCTIANSSAALQNTNLTSCQDAAGVTRGVVRFGPDQFRHANFLENQNDTIQFEGRYRHAEWDLKFGLQRQTRDVYNLFVPNSLGTYYFDSIADFQAGNANRLVYQNHPSGDPTAAAAVFDYSINTAYLQTSWRLTEELRVTAGVRHDSYAMDSAPALNQNFVDRYGFGNQQTYNGLNILMPRVSFDWRAADTVRVSGSFGLYSGGLPDVFLSNSFSNTGILTGQLDIQRTTTGFRDAGNVVLPAGVGALALNGLRNSNFGRNVPGATLNPLLAANPLSETNSIAQDFEVPAEWRTNVSARFTDLPFGFSATLEGVLNRVETTYAFRDLRAVRLVNGTGQQMLTPDGRIRYDALNNAQRAVLGLPALSTTAEALRTGQNRDIQIYSLDSGDIGDGVTLALTLEREIFGIDASVTYTYGQQNELSSSGRFGSTAGTLYNSAWNSLDPNRPTYGRAQEEINESVKYSLDWRANAFGNLETRFSLTGDLRAGRPFSWSMFGGTGRNPHLGVNAGATNPNRSNHLAYIPDLSGTVTSQVSGSTTSFFVSSDSRVAFDSQATIDQLRTMINTFGLTPGQIVDRGSNRNDDIHLVNLVISQELPSFTQEDRARVQFSVNNLLNLINDEWGLIEEFNDQQNLYTFACAGANGVADTAGVANCNRYRISSVSTLNLASPTRRVDRSRWQLQMTLQYEF